MGCCTSCTVVEGPMWTRLMEGAESSPPASPAHACASGCGRPAYRHFATCCSRCKGADGPHSNDCGTKGLCGEGCGRRAAVAPDGKVFKTCCKSCPHLKQERGCSGHDVDCDVRDNGGSCPPWYWKSVSAWPADFHEEIGGEYVKKMATKLLQKSLTDKEVVQCERIEDSTLWKSYAAKRREIRERLVLSWKLETKTDWIKINPETSEDIEFSARTTLDGGVNEVWLFHGTSLDAARGIAKSNFKLPSSAGNFGKGAYFAEKAYKSESYAKTVDSGKYAGCKVMLLCRVVLGNVYNIAKGTDRQAERLVNDPNFDSVCGIAHIYREFLVYDVAQIYPEYILYYKSKA